MNKLFFLSVLITNLLLAQVKPDYSPQFFGYVKSWYQDDFSSNQGQFLMKEVRFGAKGNVNEFSGYKLMVDFTRLGTLKTTTDLINGKTVLTSATASFSDVLMDADAYITPMKNLTFDLGQFLVPFSTDNLRGGSDIDFVNRPLSTNIAPALRDIGFMTTYQTNIGLPLELKAGLFNGSGQNKPENDKTINYSLRAVAQPVQNLSISANYYEGHISTAAVNIFDFGADYRFTNIFLSGEFGQRKSLLKNVETTSNSFFVYSFYDLDFGNSEVSHLIPAVRFEHYQPDCAKSISDINKTTFGLSIEFAKVKYAQLRVNYELYDYKSGGVNPNTLTVELLTRF